MMISNYFLYLLTSLIGTKSISLGFSSVHAYNLSILTSTFNLVLLGLFTIFLIYLFCKKQGIKPKNKNDLTVSELESIEQKEKSFLDSYGTIYEGLSLVRPRLAFGYLLIQLARSILICVVIIYAKVLIL